MGVNKQVFGKKELKKHIVNWNAGQTRGQWLAPDLVQTAKGREHFILTGRTGKRAQGRWVALDSKAF